MLDTAAIVALADSRDSNCQAARDCLKAIARQHLPTFVTLPTIYETYTRLLYDQGERAAMRFIERIFDGSVAVIRTIEEDEAAAKDLLGKYNGAGLSLVDAANMAVMLRLGIAVCFSFDYHYIQVGFIRIPPFHLK